MEVVARLFEDYDDGIHSEILRNQAARLRGIGGNLPEMMERERSAAVHSVLDEALNSGDGTYRP
jgi:hypothetical protein